MIFESLGFKTANGWDVPRLQRKLAKLESLVEGSELDDKTQKRVNGILGAQGNGQRVVIVDSDAETANKRAQKEVDESAERERTRKEEKKEKTVKKEKRAANTKEKKAAADKKRAAATKDKKAKKTAERKAKSTVKVDKFGSREGSNNARINAVLSRKQKKMSELVQEAGISGTCYDHLKKLIADGKVVKGEKGFKLA
jgi:chromatin remodeling complex protein RSC6